MGSFWSVGDAMMGYSTLHAGGPQLYSGAGVKSWTAELQRFAM